MRCTGSCSQSAGCGALQHLRMLKARAASHTHTHSHTHLSARSPTPSPSHNPTTTVLLSGAKDVSF